MEIAPDMNERLSNWQKVMIATLLVLVMIGNSLYGCREGARIAVGGVVIDITKSPDSLCCKLFNCR
jgi:hypothetical protein